MTDREIQALMRVLAEMRRTGSKELVECADRIQDAVEEAASED